ncbi:diguanylate cyclase [Pseudomonas sp. UL073]|uniref:Diguanylate cyclase n=2 Tax=Zestomonas insulae TaxID=2809017 RepID=A0ABS2IIF3_9GAMM|nr:diguanylate cyclase [Pseudomonas insulae]MBM7061747.1 diguanylate cyclase [Pseudomonas insulae]
MAADERFNGLARLARRHFNVALSLIIRLDGGRPAIAGCDGLPLSEAARALTLCAAALPSAELLVVADTRGDPRFAQAPQGLDALLPFYAACPLLATDGTPLGALCLFDGQSHHLDASQRDSLQELAMQAAALLVGDHALLHLQAEADILRDSERRLAQAIAGSLTGIWERNFQTGEIIYSKGWKAMLGYSENEVSNRIEDSYLRVHPDDLAYVQATIQAHFDGLTERYEVEHRIRCKDGRYKWICSRGQVVGRDNAGKPLRMIGTTSDISATRAMSESLQQSVDLITSLTNEVPGLVFQYRRRPDGAAYFSYVSAGIQDIYEVRADQVANDTAAIEAIIHPDDLPAYAASLDLSALNLTPWHLEYRVVLPRQGLRWRQGDARPQRLEDGSTLWHGFITDVTERKRIEAELQEFATIDFLTQLPNRRHFMAQIDAELARIQRGTDHSAAVLMCDLDHFKSINDQWGHAIGDLALKHFASLLREQLRKIDIAGRVGGEEFAVVLVGADSAEAVAFAQRVQQRMAASPLFDGDRHIPLTISVGVAVMESSDASALASLSRSDTALYRAKQNGRNRIEYQPLSAAPVAQA